MNILDTFVGDILIFFLEGLISFLLFLEDILFTEKAAFFLYKPAFFLYKSDDVVIYTIAVFAAI